MMVDGALAVGRLIAELGGVDGRKRLQKLVHLLAVRHRQDFKQRFILHYYGPFSRQLAAQLDFLCAAELVEETASDDMSGCSYRVAGDKAREQINSLWRGANERPPWVELATQLNLEKTPFLEAVSTLVFLCSAGTHRAKLKAEFTETKPQLTHYFEEAVQFAQEHKLIR